MDGDYPMPADDYIPADLDADLEPPPEYIELPHQHIQPQQPNLTQADVQMLDEYTNNLYKLDHHVPQTDIPTLTDLPLQYTILRHNVLTPDLTLRISKPRFSHYTFLSAAASASGAALRATPSFILTPDGERLVWILTSNLACTPEERRNSLYISLVIVPPQGDLVEYNNRIKVEAKPRTNADKEDMRHAAMLQMGLVIEEPHERLQRHPEGRLVLERFQRNPQEPPRRPPKRNTYTPPSGQMRLNFSKPT